MPVKYVDIAGKETPVIIDSGASCDIMDQNTWGVLKRDGCV